MRRHGGAPRRLRPEYKRVSRSRPPGLSVRPKPMVSTTTKHYMTYRTGLSSLRSRNGAKSRNVMPVINSKMSPLRSGRIGNALIEK